MTGNAIVAGELRIAPVTSETWRDFEALFSAPGGPKYCWCMAWRDIADRQKATNDDRREAMRMRVAEGIPVGLLAYLSDTPVGWCSVAPRGTFLKLSPAQDDAERDVWSIVCFFVPRAHRSRRIGQALLDAAVGHAFAQGASAVEAYPVDPDSPSYRFMGFRETFARRGFVETGTAGSRRHVMRLARS